jgi:hypothetical protein
MLRRTNSLPKATGAPADTAGLSPKIVQNSRNSISSNVTFLFEEEFVEVEVVVDWIEMEADSIGEERIV